MASAMRRFPTIPSTLKSHLARFAHPGLWTCMTNQTDLDDSPTDPHKCAPHPHARLPSVSSTAGTTAASAAASSAPSTRSSRCASTSTLSSTRRASGSVHAIAATRSTASGSRCVRVARIATALVVASLPVRVSRRPRRRIRCIARTCVSAASRIASPVPGTGAPSRRMCVPAVRLQLLF